MQFLNVQKMLISYLVRIVLGQERIEGVEMGRSLQLLLLLLLLLLLMKQLLVGEQLQYIMRMAPSHWR